MSSLNNFFKYFIFFAILLGNFIITPMQTIELHSSGPTDSIVSGFVISSMLSAIYHYDPQLMISNFKLNKGLEEKLFSISMTFMTICMVIDSQYFIARLIMKVV